MKTIYRHVSLLLPLFVLFLSYPVQGRVAGQEPAYPTPTYDPLAEPPLPENPTELERGRNLYWHWCMPCHGDRGQGLTDEFRAIWEPDHQNCWDRGCHGGQGLEEGFPIPTVVPGIVNERHLTHFAAVRELSSYLEKTHPPQSPGILEGDEYHSIALFVFTMNGRSLAELPVADTPAATSTPTLLPHREPLSPSLSLRVVTVFALLLAGIYALARKAQLSEPPNP